MGLIRGIQPELEGGALFEGETQILQHRACALIGELEFQCAVSSVVSNGDRPLTGELEQHLIAVGETRRSVKDPIHPPLGEQDPQLTFVFQAIEDIDPALSLQLRVGSETESGGIVGDDQPFPAEERG